MTRVLNFLLWGFLLMGLTSCSQKQPPAEMVTKPYPSVPSPIQKPLPPVAPQRPTLAPTAVVAPPTHKIGLLLPLTGPHADLGKGMLQAAEMALFETRASFLTLLPQDTAQGAHQAALKAIDEGAELLLGPLFAAEVEAVKPLLHARNVNLISFSTDQNVADHNVFILGFLPSQQIERVALFAREKGITRLAAFTPDDQYGHLIDHTLKRLEARGDIQLIGITHYTRGDILEGNPGNTRLLEDLAIYQQKGLDALVLPEGGENLAHLMRIFGSQGALRVLGSGQWENPATLEPPIMGLDGGIFATTTPDERKKFEARFTNAYGAVPPRIATLAYDAVALAVSLADRGYTPQNLTFSEGFSGIDGLFRLTPQGLNERGLAILEVNSSGFRTLNPAPRSF